MPPIDPSKLPANALAPKGITPQPFPGAGTAPIVVAPNPHQVGEAQKVGFDSQEQPLKIQADKNNLKESQMRLSMLPFNSGMALGDPKLSGQARLASIPPQYRPLVQDMLDGKYPAISSFGLSRPQLMSLLGTATAVDPSFDPSLFAPRLRAITDFTGMGKGAQVIGSVEREAGSLKMLKAASDALANPNAGFGPLNKVIAYVEQNTGRKNINAKQAYELLVDENARQLDRIMKSSGSTSVTGVEELRKDLTNLNATDTRNAAFSAAAGMMSQALRPLQMQWDSAYGGNKAPPMWLSKNSSDFLNSLAPDEVFGGDQWRGLPGLKGDGTAGQATPVGGHSPDYYNPAKDPAFKFPANDQPVSEQEKALNPDLQPIKLPEGYQEAHTQFLQQHPPGSLTADQYTQFRQALDKQYSELGVQPLQSQLDPKTVKTFVDAYNQQGLNPDTPVPTGTIPSNLLEKAAVSAPGIFAAKAANAASLGIPDLLAGQEGRDAMGLAANAHPDAALMGEIAGSIAPIAGLSGLAEKGIENAGEGYLAREGFSKLGGQAVGNAVYGGARGFTGSGGDPTATAVGAGVGAAVAPVGATVVQGADALIPQTTKNAISALGDTALTIPQRAGLGKTEEVFRNVMGMRGGQARAFASWNKQNVNMVLNGLDPMLRNTAGIESQVPASVDAGTGKIQFLNGQLNKGYNTIKPQITGQITPEFVESVNGLTVPQGNPTSQMINEKINEALSHLYSDPENGGFNGDSYVKAQTSLRGLAGQLAKAADGDTLDNVTAADGLKRVQAVSNEVTNLAKSQMAPELSPQLDSLEKAWAQKLQLEDATTKAVSQNGGVYSPSQRLTTIKKFDPSTNNTMYASGQDPFGGDAMPNALAAQKVMGSSNVSEKANLRDSFYGSPVALGTAPLYLPGSRQAIAAALFKRPGNAIYDKLPDVLSDFLSRTQPVTLGADDFLRNKLTGN